MGNNTSTEEAAGGGFLIALGTALSFTPAGPFTSTWMIPLGGSLLTGKPQPIGMGMTYKDDGEGIKPYIGNPDRAIVNREIEYDQEKIKWKSYKDYADMVDSLKKYDFNKYLEEKNEKINVFRFITYKKTEDQLLKNIEDLFPKKDYSDGELVDRVYVIRRKLDIFPVYFGWIAHSGLLLKTKKGKYYICEYGVEKNPNKTSLYEIQGIKESNCDIFEAKDGRKWNKQICGKDLSKNITIHQIKETMENKVSAHNYWILFWNCHMAQEMTRSELGLGVDSKYLNKKYNDEMDYILSTY